MIRDTIARILYRTHGRYEFDDVLGVEPPRCLCATRNTGRQNLSDKIAVGLIGMSIAAPSTGGNEW